MTRERLAWLLGALGLLLGAWWLSLNTEWVEVYSRRGAQGEARDNPVYAFEQLLRRLGMQVERHEALKTLPPAQARLVLLSSDWQLMPERSAQLQQWVLQGGHLVLAPSSEWDNSALADWVPVELLDIKPSKRSRQEKALTSEIASMPQPREALVSTPPLWDRTESIASCDARPDQYNLRPRRNHAPAWTLARKSAVHALRVPLGRGSVTALNSGLNLFHNEPALRCDNPLLLAAAVQAEAGAVTWIYLHEKRQALLPWLWQQSWIAILAGLLALAAALWRAAVRFGPLMAAPPRLRRSISEQVRGLGAFLHQGGREALLAAQQRALVEAAQRQLPGFARMKASERAAAVAAATGLPALELSTALSTRFCTRAQLPPLLLLLETARRRLAHQTSDERHPT
ncbi:DUF4350 domain-containing protein [Inhella proteolytica]|uniref:DUF4350 domain-containing protein n=1 Tax=Inhella proteolytica TaxID=2795029 RepID=A0A931NE72_9BURK|nr:DUF4350 domain-containing protein [Inhella proteolytica]MBH9577382.1 DUF4350 domain-containing protein [Inhella proteolytica]